MSGTARGEEPAQDPAGDSPPAEAAWPKKAPAPPAGFFGQAGVRFGMIYASLFGASSLALAAFLWWSTAGLLDRQNEAAITVDSQGLVDRYREGGLQSLVETIDQRIAGNIDDDGIYYLADANLQRIAGNLDRWPRRLPTDFEWAQLQIDRNGSNVTARVHREDLPCV